MSSSLTWADRLLMLISSPLPWMLTVNKILGTADGKDKLLRLVQFIMKFLSGYLGDTVDRAKALRMEDALATGRKLFRFMRALESLVKIQLVLGKLVSRQEGDGGSSNQLLLPCCELVQQGGLLSFWLVDHFFLLSKLSIVPIDQNIMRSYFGGTFTVACVGGLAGNVTRLHQINSLSPSVRAKHREKSEIAYRENIVDGVKNGLDIIIGLNIAYDKKWDSKLIGAIGATTSCIWLWQMYQNHLAGNITAARLEVPVDEKEHEN